MFRIVTSRLVRRAPRRLLNTSAADESHVPFSKFKNNSPTIIAGGVIASIGGMAGIVYNKSGRIGDVRVALGEVKGEVSALNSKFDFLLRHNGLMSSYKLQAEQAARDEKN